MRAHPSAEDQMRAIASNVRSARLKRGLTQVDLARESGVSRSLIIRLETSASDVHVSSLSRIAKVLRVRVRDLVDYRAAGDKTR